MQGASASNLWPIITECPVTILYLLIKFIQGAQGIYEDLSKAGYPNSKR